MADPAYSITWPVPPAAPVSPMTRSAISPPRPAKVALDGDPQVPGGLLKKGLRGQHVLDFRGADTEGERPESAVGRRVAIAANNGRAGQGEALFRSHDVNDALTDIVHF